MEPAPYGFHHAAPFDPLAWPLILADRQLPDGRHLVLGDIDGPHHLWLRSNDPAEPLAFAIICDNLADLRHKAAARLGRRLSGAPPARQFKVFKPTPYQQYRLKLLLAVLDMVNLPNGEAATTYMVARSLVYPHMHICSSAEWKSSSERRQTQRLIDDALTLMRGGYRALLCAKAMVRQK